MHFNVSLMMELQFVPIQSYYKSTLVELYNNEGEVGWNFRKLKNEINARKELLEKLEATGYNQTIKSFTAQQVSLIFKYISHPILNERNINLLKL
jgi:hypothetical protein